MRNEKYLTSLKNQILWRNAFAVNIATWVNLDQNFTPFCCFASISESRYSSTCDLGVRLILYMTQRIKIIDADRFIVMWTNRKWLGFRSLPRTSEPLCVSSTPKLFSKLNFGSYLTAPHIFFLRRLFRGRFRPPWKQHYFSLNLAFISPRLLRAESIVLTE